MMSSSARLQVHQASRSAFTLRQARLTTSLLTAPLKSAKSARFTRRVFVPVLIGVQFCPLPVVVHPPFHLVSMEGQAGMICVETIGMVRRYYLVEKKSIKVPHPRVF